MSPNDWTGDGSSASPRPRIAPIDSPLILLPIFKTFDPAVTVRPSLKTLSDLVNESTALQPPTKSDRLKTGLGIVVFISIVLALVGFVASLLTIDAWASGLMVGGLGIYCVVGGIGKWLERRPSKIDRYSGWKIN